MHPKFKIRQPALFSALREGSRAARFASEAAPPEIDYEEVKRFKKNIFAPMKSDKGLLPVRSNIIYVGAKTAWRRLCLKLRK